MKITGTIRGISIKQGKVPYGFIAPDTPIAGHEGNILFFADKLIGITLKI